jgi:hypothetical protein
MPAGSTPILAGVAGATITPDRSLPLEGYRGERPATGVLDPLEARAVVLDDGRTRAAVLALDLCGIQPDTVARIRAGVERLAGLAGDHVVVTFSHTHGAPRVTPYLGETVDAGYLEWLADAAARVVAAAGERLWPVTVGAGIGQVDFNVNRRRHTGRGTAFAPNPFGPIDRRVRVLRLDHAQAPPAPGTLGGRALPQADPLALLFSYPCHATVLGADNPQYTSDYPGAARRFVERAYPAGGDGPTGLVRALFLPGCAGNLRPHLLTPDGRFRPGTPAELAVLGRWLGSEVVRVAEQIAGEHPAGLAIGRQEVVLPYARVPGPAELRAALDGPRAFWAGALLAKLEQAGRLPEAERTEVQVLRLGRHWLVALPGETTLEIGLAVERGLAELGLVRPERGDLVLTVGYANDYLAYLPSASLMVEGGYEAESWYEYLRCGPFVPALEAILANATLSLAQTLAGPRV